MKTAFLRASLLSVLVAGSVLQAHAAADEPSSLPQETCASVRHEIDAVSTHLRAAQADRAGQAPASAGEAKLALELGAHLDALRANLPAQRTPRAQASLLLSDMRDALSLMRNATHIDARQLAVRRLEEDHRLYNVLLQTLGCADPRPTAL